MPYIEQTPQRRFFLLLPLVFAVCYLVNTWVAELGRSEAFLGIVAREMAANREFLHITFQGEPVRTFPFYPALVAVVGGLGMPSTFTTRLPAGLAVLATALVCGLFVARRQGWLGGMVTGSMMLTNLACLRLGQRAQAETLLMLWLACAWLSWYAFGQERKHWGRAWGLALLFVFLGSLTVGARAVLYFYIPFLFLKQPIRGKRRLLQPYHFLTLAVFALGLTLWLQMVPGQPFMPWNAENLRPGHGTNLVLDRLVFPVKLALYLMPWTALAWTPFCVAFWPVERQPVLFHYLRTQIISLTVFVWLIPWSSTLMLLPVLPALAILTGCHFEILIRRHKPHLERYLALLGWGALALATGLLALVVLLTLGVVDLVGFPLAVVFRNAVVMLLAALLAVLALRAGVGGKQPYWLRFVLVVCALRLLAASVLPPLEAWAGNERRQVAEVMVGKLSPLALHGGHGPVMGGLPAVSLVPPPSGDEAVAPPPAPAPSVPGLPPEVETVYIARPPLVVESFYLGRHVLKVKNLERDLPADAPVVYVVGGAQPPILPSRAWTAASPLLDARRRNWLSWAWLPGEWCLLRVAVGPREPTADHTAIPTRLYRGERR